MTSATRELDCGLDFKPLLTHFEPLLLESNVVCAYGLWSDLRLAYLSPGWVRFSKANGGEPEVSSRWGLGDNILTGIHGPLRGFFEANYKRCLAEQRPWEHAYECSSPDHFRLFEALTYPLENSDGLLVIHCRRIERPFAPHEMSSALPPSAYIDNDGFYHQCGYCRRMRRIHEPAVWDRVRDWVRLSPPETSHGICEACAGYYWPRVEANQTFVEAFRTSEHDLR